MRTPDDNLRRLYSSKLRKENVNSENFMQIMLPMPIELPDDRAAG